MFVLRWISLIVVMSGVALVGYSGSLIKDVVKVVTPLLARALGDRSPTNEDELSRVLVGKFFSPISDIKTSECDASRKVFSLFCLRKYCKSTSLLVTHARYLLPMMHHIDIYL